MADRPSTSASRRPKLADDSIGSFIVEQEIGKGSFAQVYSGRHKTTGALVAIKAVELARLNKKLKENLYGEIKILKALRHPHIVALHDCIENSTHINLIMEYCELGDLSLFIKKREKLITNPATHDIARKYPNAPNSGLNEVVTRHFLKQLASALKFLREGNFVHRDVKPQNLLLLPSPQFRETCRASKILTASQDSLTPATGLASLPMLKLADFGFARVLPSTSLAETLCGSPLYMAPEILRYERYDAKADLWSVGTVLFEMVTGRPPFRASNHVELLRKIEHAEDMIKFSRDSIVSTELKALIRALLKRSPVERLSFDNFFGHAVVVNPIPGLVEDDIPKEERRRELKITTKLENPTAPARRSSFRRYPGADLDGREAGPPSSPKVRRASPLATPMERSDPFEQQQARLARPPGLDTAECVGSRRPILQPSTSAPSRAPMYVDRRTRGLSSASMKTAGREYPPPGLRMDGRPLPDEQERAAQDVAFERDYVVVEKKQVEVNALADQLAAARGEPPKPGQMIKRATQQGPPTSSTGAVPSSPSQATRIAQGRDPMRHGSYDKALSSSPGSATSVISKAIQDASIRLLGYRFTPGILGKGHSPPQIYSPFPVYPTPSAPAGLIGDGKQSAPVDEDSRVVQCIEDLAHRSDVVYGFAEVKYKQLLPLAPSMDHGLGGVSADEKMADDDDDDGLTAEAKVALSEEALVLYVKALSLLAKSMDIASLWWSRKTKAESSSGHVSMRESALQSMALRINSAVQWIRSRFNEVLEKAEVVRLKLVEAQKQVPGDHPSHPSNHTTDMATAASSTADGVFLTPGISAEKLMYERALEMSRAAAINEIANEDLQGCELSYVTAVKLLEAVLENDEDLPKRRISGIAKDDKLGRDKLSGEMNLDDQQAVQQGRTDVMACTDMCQTNFLAVIQMITSRLRSVRGKMQIIAAASKAQQQQRPPPARQRSGDGTPRNAPAS